MGCTKEMTLSDGTKVTQELTPAEFQREMMQLNGRIDVGLQMRFAAYFEEIKNTDEFIKRIAAAKTEEERDAVDREILSRAEQRIFAEHSEANAPKPVQQAPAPAPDQKQRPAAEISAEQERALLYQCYLVAQARLKICQQPTIHEITELDSDDLADMLAEFKLMPFDQWHQLRFGEAPR